ncbi:MAG: alpha-L-fucosidase [Vulcanimicrobiaceae bacterium]
MLSRRSFLASSASAGALALTGLPRALAANGPYTADLASLSTHPLPQWYADAKFGIFIHWGAYSVPQFAKVGDSAEWYWEHLRYPHMDDGAVFEHHRKVWGENFAYDQFIPRFKAERYDPVAWVKFFEAAGAKYFVLTSKHHEGLANFHTTVSNRNVLRMGPKRDVLGELFNAAREHTQLKCGSYYSLGEFFNPAAKDPPYNCYTHAPVPYTGYIPVNDYVDDFMHPQMKELIDQYDPDILWGDGQWFFAPKGAEDKYWHNESIVAYYFNHAASRAQPKEVVVNNRFFIQKPDGNPWGDFGTPEQETLKNLQASKWETCQTFAGSWGYNAAEPVSRYKTGATIIRMLADVVSKNGNVLFNIGPRHDGTISPAMQERLLEVGAWLRINGEAIYASHYWKQAEDGNVRFTTKPGKFYMTALDWPGDSLEITAPIPIHDDTKIRLLGSDGPAIPWSRKGSSIVLKMPQAGPSATTSKHAYTFVFDVA